MNVVRVVLVDDEPMIRSGIRTIVEATGDARVVGDAGDGRQALAVIREKNPDIVLLDIRMPEMDGITAAKKIAEVYPEVGIIMLTTFGESDYVTAALSIGVSGFVLKSGEPEELSHAIRASASGGAYFSPQVAAHLVQHVGTSPRIDDDARRRVDRLSERETDILLQLAEGASNTEIAESVYLSVGTVKWHVTRILRTLGARNRVEAALLAYRSGLVT
ncbi:response regulator transcription factor [uncultured Corynebacterium sp.]|uniref:response regulator n=1 Tax=uncultured Corynebacterium sp. TaxID=159447 RepID=UPI0025EFAEE2|nr:response regulator transcription factor [uncultured Corynebacterium sp.]